MDYLDTWSGLIARPRRQGNALAGGVFAVVCLLVAALPTIAQNSPLPPEKAFRFAARALNPHTVEASFNIADGYYLYRDKVHFVVEPQSSDLTPPVLPSGKIKEDAFFGKVETYRGNVVVNLDLKDTAPGQNVTVQAESQGCADIGICYPPTVQRITLALPAASAPPTPANTPAKKSWFN
jgi:thioredoxin:protein disulfide reductase